jgi:hypothetical protein
VACRGDMRERHNPILSEERVKPAEPIFEIPNTVDPFGIAILDSPVLYIRIYAVHASRI